MGIRSGGGLMEKKLIKRIMRYILLSVILLVSINFLTIAYQESIANKAMIHHAQYEGVAFKHYYEEFYKFEAFYAANEAEYKKLYVHQWHQIIEKLYNAVEIADLPDFFDYLTELETACHVSIEIYEDRGVTPIYPLAGRVSKNSHIAGLNIDVIKETLDKEGNILHEVNNQKEHRVSKIVQQKSGVIIAVTSSEILRPYDYESMDSHERLAHGLEGLVGSNECVEDYYIMDENQVVLFSDNEAQIHHKLQVKTANDELLSYGEKRSKGYYEKQFYINDSLYEKHTLYSVLLNDGNYLLVVIDNYRGNNAVNEMKVLSMLMMIIGLVAIYFIGNIIIYLIDSNKLTGRRTASSSKATRMAISVFAALILLNGMAVIQVTRISYVDSFENDLKDILFRYGQAIERKEIEYKRFIERLREDSLMKAVFVYKGEALINTSGADDSLFPLYSYAQVDSFSVYNIDKAVVDKSIAQKGFYEFYSGPKLFNQNDFESFYENYLIEALAKEYQQVVSKIMIFPYETRAYIAVEIDIRPEMILIQKTRQEFLALLKAEEREFFVSDTSIYNDTGIALLSYDSSDKIDLRHQKDYLTDKPLWYWYQFKQGELFRTIEKTVEDNYIEQYSMVSYLESYEYYIVYKIPSEKMFLELERLYNIYVSAIMFLLLGVFLTLGIKVKLKKRG